MFKCIIETPDGETLIGRGLDPFAAYTDSMKNLELVKTDKRGPGIWELQDNKSNNDKKNRKQ